MNSITDNTPPHSVQAAEVAPAMSPQSRRLRTWLIVLTVLATLVFLAAILSTLIATSMTAFALDDPSATMDDVWRLLGTVWGVAAVFFTLLIVGVVGGWIAYRTQHHRLSLSLSLLAALAVFLFLAGIVLLVLVINSILPI